MLVLPKEELNSSINLSLCPLAGRLGAYESARRAWPAVKLSFDQFSDHLDRLGGSSDLSKYPEQLYIAAACALGHEAACVTLERSFFPALELALKQRRDSSDFIQEVLQLTRERVLVAPRRRIATYRGKAPLGAWLLVVARHLADDLHRREKKDRRLISLDSRYGGHPATDGSSMPEPCTDAERCARWTERVETSLRVAIDALGHDDMRVLHARYVEGRSVVEIAQAAGVHRTTIYRLMERLERRLARCVQRDIRATFGRLSEDIVRALFQVAYANVSLDGCLSRPEFERPTLLFKVRIDGRDASNETTATDVSLVLAANGRAA
jgi:RNA polymerase sigma-70 factor, ECF subfamily